MSLKKTAILFIVFTICFFNKPLAGQPEKVSCLGKVVNAEGFSASEIGEKLQ